MSLVLKACGDEGHEGVREGVHYINYVVDSLSLVLKACGNEGREGVRKGSTRI